MRLQKLKSIAHRLLPLCPPKWRLPFLARVYSFTGWDAEAKWLKAIGPNRGLAIDIGANYGFYTWALARLYTRVIAFEPNKQVATTLVAAELKTVEVIHSGLSSQCGTATFYIPRVNGSLLSGWASLDQGNCPSVTDFELLEIPLRTLDSFQFEDVGFIKIDVEGHEIEALQGGMQTIRRDMPHMLVEIKDQHLDRVRAMLQDWGYVETTLPDLGGPPGSKENYLFVPSKI